MASINPIANKGLQTDSYVTLMNVSASCCDSAVFKYKGIMDSGFTSQTPDLSPHKDRKPVRGIRLPTRQPNNPAVFCRNTASVLGHTPVAAW